MVLSTVQLTPVAVSRRQNEKGSTLSNAWVGNLPLFAFTLQAVITIGPKSLYRL